MNKLKRQTELIKLIAKEPWQHTRKSIAQRFVTSEVTVKRDLMELTQKEYEFAENDHQEFYLQSPGWCELNPLKEATLRRWKF